MNTKKTVSAFVVLILVFSAAAIAVHDRDENQKRVIARTETEISKALAKGCSMLQDARTLKAFS